MSNNKTLMCNSADSPMTEENTPPNNKWAANDIKRLQEYCLKMGISDVDISIIPPIVILGLLKDKYGDNDGTPLKETSKFNPNNSYGESIRRKQILHG